jgi:molecular chaperone DnaK
MFLRNYGVAGFTNETIKKELFESIVKPIISAKILKTIDEALSKAGGLTPASIDGVVVVGGSSNLRLFEYAIMNLFSNAVIITPDTPQWSTAIGAAYMQIIGGSYSLSDSVCVILSDGDIYPVLPKGQSVNEPIDRLEFSLVKDSPSAHFIFTDSSGEKIYAKKKVATKGFLQEELVLSATIGSDQIARIEIVNKNFDRINHKTIVELNKLTFHYDISALGESD